MEKTELLAKLASCEQFFITEQDFGLGDDTEVKNAALEAKNDDLDVDRDVEDDMGGVDIY